MAFRRFGFILVGLVLLLAACGGQPTETEEAEVAELETSGIEQAIERVVSEVVGEAQFDTPLIVFALDEPLQPGDVIGAYQYEGYEPVPVQRTIDAPTWFFWIERTPGGEFAHVSTFVYVDATSGAISTSAEMWWPVLNGEGLWVKEADYWDMDNWVFHNVDFRPEAHLGRATSKVFALPAFRPALDNGGTTRGIVVNGWKPGQSGEENFAANADQAVNELSADGFDVDYYGPENSMIPAENHSGDPDGAAVAEWFRLRSDELGEGDTLFVYITGHGLPSTSSGNVGGVSERSLQTFLGRFDPAVEVIVVVQGCFSGLYLDGLNDLADLTITSTDALTVSYMDIDPHPIDSFLPFVNTDDVNPSDRGSEFSSGFWEDWRGVREDPAQQAIAKDKAARTATGYWSNVAGTSFVSAVEKDAAVRYELEFPHAVWGSQATRPAVLVDETDDGVSCIDGTALSPGQTPPGVDIGSVLVQQSPDGSTMDVEIKFPRVTVLDQRMLAGVEFNDPELPMSPPNPNWYFDGIGNLNYFVTVAPPNALPNLHEYGESSGWRDNPDVIYEAEIVNNSLMIHLPIDSLPNGPFYAFASSGSFCDSVALSTDKVPEGWVPPPVIPEIIVLGDSAADPNAPLITGSAPLLFDDNLGDPTLCTDGTPQIDPVVDIRQTVIRFDPLGAPNPLGITVLFDDPAAAVFNEFSFATQALLVLDGSPQSMYLWEVHDKISRIGRVDISTGELISSEAQVDLSPHLMDGTETAAVEFMIPAKELPPNGFNLIQIDSFHMPTPDGPWTCDQLTVDLVKTSN